MTLDALSLAPQLQPCAQLSGEVRPLAFERCNPSIRPVNENEHSISIFDPIGFDSWTGEGVTAERITAALRTIEGADVTVSINSSGGDMFEGRAIYNLLRNCSDKIVIKVLGLAASAASIVAMIGDEARTACAGFLNIHHCRGVAMGNNNDLLEVAKKLASFDLAIEEIYAARTCDSHQAIQQLMSADSWIACSAVVE